MSYPYEAGLSLGSAYSGQASALTAQVLDNSGALLLSVPTFAEIGTGSGIYAASITLTDSWNGAIVYTWTGTPAITTALSEPVMAKTAPGWYTAPIDVSGSVAAILTRTDVATSTRLAASAYTAPPTDYQQRGVAVTLPARDFTTIIPLNSPHGSEGEALLAARAQGAGTWSRTGNVIHLLAPDKTTVLFTLTFDDITNPLLRTET